MKSAREHELECAAAKPVEEEDVVDRRRFSADVERIRQERRAFYSRYGQGVVQGYDGTRAYLARAWHSCKRGMYRAARNNLELASNMAEAHEAASFFEEVDDWVRRTDYTTYRMLVEGILVEDRTTETTP